MSRPLKKRIANHPQDILDSFRRIVKSLRQSAVSSEKQYGLSSAQLFVLQTLSDSASPLSVNELAERTLTHQSSVSVVISKLVNRSLVKKVRSKSDSRRAELQITAEGKKALKKRPDLIQERLVQAIQLLPKSQQKQLASNLLAVVKEAGLGNESPSMLFEEKE